MNLTQKWHSLSTAERRTIMLGSAIVVLALLWAYLWLPLQDGITAHRETIQRQRSTLAKVQYLLEQTGQTDLTETTRQRFNGPFLSQVDSGLRMAGLANAIRRIDPGSDNQVSITLEQASFDQLLGWLQRAENNAQLAVVTFSAQADKQAGLVNSRIVVRQR